MIKLIATDMDGTFLTDDKRMPEGVDAVLAELKKKGIRFVVASGRQYPSLAKHFPNHLDDIVFVAENGAFVLEKQQELFSFQMKPEDVVLCLDVILSIEGMEPVICGKEREYTRNEEIYNRFTSRSLQYEMQLVDDMYVYTEDVLKLFIVFAEGKSVVEGYAQLKERLHDGLCPAISGSNIIDVGVSGVNKGESLGKLQEKWGIAKEETAVFGDQFNDVELLDMGHYSYAMEGSDAGVMAHANFVGGSNNDGFVLQEICRLVGITKNGEK